ncbi:GHKL domain-containing protein [Ruminococcus sp. AF14-10]|nr:GHKL domain-containing protein [Ruminococcus sp. AF14-10]
MPPLYRVAEVCLYSLLNFVPFMGLALYPFQNRLRFSKKVTAGMILVLTLLQLFLGNLAAFGKEGNGAFLSALSSLIYAIFYLTAVKMPVGKTLFTLLMISNLANFLVVSSKCIEGQIFPELARQSYRWSYSLIFFLVQLVFWLPLFIYIKQIYTPAVEKEPSGREWSYLWLIPGTFYLIWYDTIYANENLSSLEIALRPKNAICLFFINAGACLIYYIVSELVLEQRKTLELQQKNYQLSMQAFQYDNLQNKITEARRARHDVRHHVLLMQTYLQEKNYEALEEYLQHYQREIPGGELISYCENAAVNAVLLYFAQEAQRRGIEFEVRVNLPRETGMEETDLSVLFGNLLENALDACEEEIEKIQKGQSAQSEQKLQEAEKTQDGQIHLYGETEKSNVGKVIINASQKGQALCVTVDNTFSGKLRQDREGRLLSTKHRGSGMGTESVKMIAEKYHGVCRFEVADGMFCASFMGFPG